MGFKTIKELNSMVVIDDYYEGQIKARKDVVKLIDDMGILTYKQRQMIIERIEG